MEIIIKDKKTKQIIIQTKRKAGQESLAVASCVWTRPVDLFDPSSRVSNGSLNGLSAFLDEQPTWTEMKQRKRARIEDGRHWWNDSNLFLLLLLLVLFLRLLRSAFFLFSFCLYLFLFVFLRQIDREIFFSVGLWNNVGSKLSRIERRSFLEFLRRVMMVFCRSTTTSVVQQSLDTHGHQFDGVVIVN